RHGGRHPPRGRGLHGLAHVARGRGLRRLRRLRRSVVLARRADPHAACAARGGRYRTSTLNLSLFTVPTWKSFSSSVYSLSRRSPGSFTTTSTLGRSASRTNLSAAVPLRSSRRSTALGSCVL